MGTDQHTAGYRLLGGATICTKPENIVIVGHHGGHLKPLIDELCGSCQDQSKDTWIFNPTNSIVATTNQWQSNSKHRATVHNPSCGCFRWTPLTKHTCILRKATCCDRHKAVITIPTAGQCMLQHKRCSGSSKEQMITKHFPFPAHISTFVSGKQPVDTKGINWGRWLDTKSIHRILLSQSDLILPVLALNSSLLVWKITWGAQSNCYPHSAVVGFVFFLWPLTNRIMLAQLQKTSMELLTKLLLFSCTQKHSRKCDSLLDHLQGNSPQPGADQGPQSTRQNQRSGRRAGGLTGNQTSRAVHM